jgi:hypothetical protein
MAGKIRNISKSGLSLVVVDGDNGDDTRHDAGDV